MKVDLILEIKKHDFKYLPRLLNGEFFKVFNIFTQLSHIKPNCFLV